MNSLAAWIHFCGWQKERVTRLFHQQKSKHYESFRVPTCSYATWYKIGNTTIDYVEAVQRLNDGEYDYPNSHGLRIMQCIAEADDAGLLGRFSVDMKVAQWRWLYVTTFINEEENKNGTVDIPNDNGTTDRAVIYKGNMVVWVSTGTNSNCPAKPCRTGFIEKYGEAEGMGRVLFLYQKCSS